MSVTRVRSAIAEASKDRRVTENEAKAIHRAATEAVGGRDGGLSLAEARVLADFYTQTQAPGAAVTLGAPARRLFDGLFTGSRIPVGPALGWVTTSLQTVVPFEPGPPLSRAPSSLKQLFEVPLGKDPDLAGGPERVAYVDPGAQRMYLKLTEGRTTRWAGPMPLERPRDPELVHQPLPVRVTATGGVKVTLNPQSASGFLLSGGILAGGSLSVDLGDGRTVTVRGPKASSFAVYRALDEAMPKGTFARTAARFIEEYIAERPSTDSRVITFAKGERPGELTGSDLAHARTLRRLLAGVARGTATPAAQRPAWDARAGRFRAERGQGAALFSVPLDGGRVALVDPRSNRAFFAKPGARNALTSVTGPVSLAGTGAAFSPAGRYFTWSELKVLERRATNG
jgi:hypothetical protein